jgi:hypothetical protein
MTYRSTGTVRSKTKNKKLFAVANKDSLSSKVPMLVPGIVRKRSSRTVDWETKLCIVIRGTA